MIELKGYELNYTLNDETDVLDAFMDRDSSEYICDAITKIADEQIPIYNYDVWKDAHTIQDYIESAMEEGIAGAEEDGTVNLIKIFQAGYYQYYSQVLYENLDSLCFNYVARKVNDYLHNENTDKIDENEIESRIESETQDYDHNNMFDALEDIANEIIEEIKEEEFAM